jgi:hypothetical protein
MEKVRRRKERESAAHRIKHIDARFQEIEAEIDARLKSLGLKSLDERSGGEPVHAPPKRGPHKSTAGFKLRY